MSKNDVCPKCGTPQVSGDLCSRCVMGFALEEATDPPAPAVEALSPGSRVGPYEIASILGTGGMGTVYRARHTSLERDVALKVISAGVAAEPEFVERFRREAKALAALSHPNIVTVYDGGVADGRPYLAMELVEGVSLRSLLVERRLPPREALAIVPQLCDALEYAHDAGIVHRDIKPENILIDRAGRVKIADFGIAKLVREPERALTRTNVAIGTPAYMAPEQFNSAHDVDHRADIYSMGVVFYEMLTGDVPRGRFAPPSKKAPMHRGLDHIVMKALEERPEERYQRAEHVKRDVTSLPAVPVSTAPRTSRLAVAALLMAFLGVVAPFLFLLSAPPGSEGPTMGCGIAAAIILVSLATSIIAIAVIGSSRGRLRGRAFAWTALVICACSFLGMATLLIARAEPEPELRGIRADTPVRPHGRKPRNTLAELWPPAGKLSIAPDERLRRAEDPVALEELMRELGMTPHRARGLKKMWHTTLEGGKFELSGYEFDQHNRALLFDTRLCHSEAYFRYGQFAFVLRVMDADEVHAFRVLSEEVQKWLDTEPQ